MAAGDDSISTLTIIVDDEEKLAELRQRAALHGRTVAEEAGQVLQAALTPALPDNMAVRLRRHFDERGGDDLKIPDRDCYKDLPFTFGFDEPEAEE